ncbi:MAG: hypothetical protein WC123_07620 [Bacilli bacterium]
MKNYDEFSDNIIATVLDAISVISNLKDEDNRLCEATAKHIDLAAETLQLNDNYNASINLFFNKEDFCNWINTIGNDYFVKNCYCGLEKMYNDNFGTVEIEYNFFVIAPSEENNVTDYSLPWNLYISILVAF